MVLKACDKNSESSKTSEPIASNLTNGTATVNGAHTSKDSFETVSKKAKLQEKIDYSDLKDKTDSASVNLRLHKMEGYLHGPTPIYATKYTTSEDVIAATQIVSHEMQHWMPQFSQVELYDLDISLK